MPRPAPLLSRTPATAAGGGDTLEWGRDTVAVLREEGFTQHQIEAFLRDSVAQQADTPAKL